MGNLLDRGRFFVYRQVIGIEVLFSRDCLVEKPASCCLLSMRGFVTTCGNCDSLLWFDRVGGHHQLVRAALHLFAGGRLLLKDGVARLGQIEDIRLIHSSFDARAVG